MPGIGGLKSPNDGALGGLKSPKAGAIGGLKSLNAGAIEMLKLQPPNEVPIKLSD